MKKILFKKILSILVLLLCLFIFYDIFHRITSFSKHYNIQWTMPNDKTVQTKFHKRTPQSLQFVQYQYYYYLLRVVQNKWINPLQDENIQACIQIAINKNGQATSYELIESSGNKLYDDKAVETLLSTTPFQPIPEILQKQELFLNFCFKGSGNIVTNSPHKQLKNNVNQTGIKTSTPKIDEIKKARIDFSDDSLTCQEEIYNKWRPALTENSNITININLDNDGRMHITNISPKTQTEAATAAANAINNIKCSSHKNAKTVKMNFVVENINDDPKRIFGPLLYKIFMN